MATGPTGDAGRTLPSSEPTGGDAPPVSHYDREPLPAADAPLPSYGPGDSEPVEETHPLADDGQGGDA